MLCYVCLFIYVKKFKQRGIFIYSFIFFCTNNPTQFICKKRNMTDTTVTERLIVIETYIENKELSIGLDGILFYIFLAFVSNELG